MSGEPVTTNLFSHSEPTAYGAGTAIFSEGEPAETLYVIKSGRVEISKAGDVLSVLGAGEVFGEMSLVDDTPRSAAAIAKDDVEVVEITSDRFDFMVAQTPGFARLIMRTMAHRLRMGHATAT